LICEGHVHDLEKITVADFFYHVVWEKNSLCYKNIRVILAENDFQNWRSRFFG
jgi:hypothetical protein